MTTGVHDAVSLALELHVHVLLERQSIHVGPQDEGRHVISGCCGSRSRHFFPNRSEALATVAERLGVVEGVFRHGALETARADVRHHAGHCQPAHDILIGDAHFLQRRNHVRARLHNAHVWRKMNSNTNQSLVAALVFAGMRRPCPGFQIMLSRG